MKSIFAALICFFALSINAQQLKSPDEFLGYSLGTKYTVHYKMVNYFKMAAAAMPDKMQLKTYGTTNEGRELLMAVISAPENMSRIEDIRKNNLRNAGVLNDKSGDPSMPTIVWLSYNVHGNETSSTETAMKVLFELLSGKNNEANNWLKNTIVIIDPCLNPDGRDRYVNWYNQIAGKNPDLDLISREHQEPWPDGRSNHYNFDLNRDWAWQTQVESRARIKVYNEWLPQVHCDFHEQNYADNYYFAPAVEPYHEVITPWQRNFQVSIGKNHAKYFDKNGWLYFTKEVFDLFYPSYGDTYPVYNGSIGMTYEQAGNSSGGLDVKVNKDDTLKLTDRIAHHFTTSMSTIEIASANAMKLNQEFKKYFEDVKTNGSGNYKTYIINTSNKNRTSSLIELLIKNNIEYSFTKTGTVVKGFRYNTGKEESYSTSASDLLISTMQSKGNLVRVLFEPQSKLADSVTYDITAWSLPYAYGLDAYAVKEKVVGQPALVIGFNIIPDNNDYAYIIEYNSFKDGQLLAGLLKNGIKVRSAQKNFSFNGKNHNKGSLIVIRKGNENKIGNMLKMVGQSGSTITPVSSGFMDAGVDFGSDKNRLLNAPRVAMLTGEGVSSTAAGEVWHLFDQELDYPIHLINANTIGNESLKDIDVIILPDGNYKILADKESNLKNWVRDGGKLIAIENAVTQMASGDWGIKSKKENEESKDASYADLKRYENRERESVSSNIPGAIYKLNIDDSHPLAFGYTDYYSLKMNANVFEFSKDGWNVGVIKQENALSGFVGNAIKSKIKDGTVIGVQDYGQGKIVYFADNPIFRCFWENGKLLIANAVFLVGQ